jgi:mono/diheme cytochrome c family protein
MRVLLALSVVMAAGGALAQQVGDPVKGLAYANHSCAECHATESGDMDSPMIGVPSFQEVADTPGVSEIALVSFFQTPHPSMPNLIVPTADARDVIAYILSLKD